MALANAVKGAVKLHDFHARSFSQGLRAIGDATNPDIYRKPYDALCGGNTTQTPLTVTIQ